MESYVRVYHGTYACRELWWTMRRESWEIRHRCVAHSAETGAHIYVLGSAFHIRQQFYLNMLCVCVCIGRIICA